MLQCPNAVTQVYESWAASLVHGITYSLSEIRLQKSQISPSLLQWLVSETGTDIYTWIQTKKITLGVKFHWIVLRLNETFAPKESAKEEKHNFSQVFNSHFPHSNKYDAGQGLLNLSQLLLLLSKTQSSAASWKVMHHFSESNLPNLFLTLLWLSLWCAGLVLGTFPRCQY